MTTSTEDAAPRVEDGEWSVRASIGLGVLLFGMLLALPFLVSGVYEASDETNDASIYVATARALLAGEGYSYLGEPFIVRPPGFSLIVAGVMSVFGESWPALHLVVSLTGVVACVLLYVLCAPRVGPLLAFLAAAGLFMSPGFRQLSNQVLSDVPGLALLLGCLVLERWASRTPSWRRDLVLGLAIGLAAYVRSQSLLLVPAIVLARAFARGAGDRAWSAFLRRRVAVLALVCAATVLPWSLRCVLRHPEPPVDQTHLYSYSTGMWHTQPYDPASPRAAVADVLRRVPQRVEQIVTSPYLGASLRGPHWAQIVLGALLVALVAWQLAERRRASELFFALYLATLCVYFAFRPRLVLPLQALGALAVVEAYPSFLLMRKVRWASPVRTIAIVLTALWCSSGILMHVAGLRERSAIRERHAQYEAAAATLAPALGEGRVASAIGWHWSVYLRRPVWSLALAARRDNAAGIEAVLARRDIRTVVLADFLPEDQALLPWFQKYWGMPERVGDASVFRRP